MDELGALADEHKIGGHWQQGWTGTFHLMRWRHAVERRGTSHAEEESQRFVDASTELIGSDSIDRALQLLTLLPLGEAATTCLMESIASAVVARFAHTMREHTSVRLLATTTEEDWGLFARYQRRFLGGRPLRQRLVAERWRPGFDLFDELTARGVVGQCAWCGRIRRGDRWCIANDILRLVADGSVSHEIRAARTATIE